MNQSIHKFHIPVMGLAYTIDSPVKVARYGISSTISIIEDRLVEMMRGHYYNQLNEPYFSITTREKNYREKRVTDYLNLVNRIVKQQVEKLKASAFEAGSEIVKYFEMLPEDSKLKLLYQQMTKSKDEVEKESLQSMLRTQVVAGSIDVNIMTKLDKNNYDKQGNLIEDGSDAISALKGYAHSNLANSSIVFSAGMNPRLYNYLEKLYAFNANEAGEFDKKIVIKVSDYRSALIQGKYLAKKGLWVSEFRIESGLNCGGHAFATDGYLLGPILEEFKTKRVELVSSLYDIYNNARKVKNEKTFSQPHPIKITVQGGVGTYEESKFLLDYYGVDSVGWGTPFLLVPEATTVDDDTLQLLKKAKKDDVQLSKSSPLGVPFHYLKGTTSHKERARRIDNGYPGSPCTEKHLITNTEFTKDPICTASSKYQKLKIQQLQALQLPQQQYAQELKNVLDKECLCIGLSNAAAITYNRPFIKNLDSVTICPGPNIAYFSKIVSLQEMTDHIYGRTNIIENVDRPHMFVKELCIYVDYLKEQLDGEPELDNNPKKLKYYTDFYKQLLNGINYCKDLLQASNSFAVDDIDKMQHGLDDAERQLQELFEDSLQAC
jgi:hypothetical protein